MRVLNALNNPEEEQKDPSASISESLIGEFLAPSHKALSGSRQYRERQGERRLSGEIW